MPAELVLKQDNARAGATHTHMHHAWGSSNTTPVMKHHTAHQGSTKRAYKSSTKRTKRTYTVTYTNRYFLARKLDFGGYRPSTWIFNTSKLGFLGLG